MKNINGENNPNYKDGKIAGITPYCETALISPYITRGQTTEGFDASKREPIPVKGNVNVLPLVIDDLKARDKIGTKKYGTTLQTDNGRDSLVDAYQEALDLCMYLRQNIEERKNNTASEFDLYQKAAEEFAIYPTLGHPIVYPALGLAGEAGEVAEKVKKMGRDDNCILTDDRKAAIKKELGDVLWYASEVSRQAGFKLSDIAKSNIEKLRERMENGTLSGDGDNR